MLSPCRFKALIGVMIALIALFVALGGGLVFVYSHEATQRRCPLTPGGTRYFMHRGDLRVAQENTERAIMAALEEGASLTLNNTVHHVSGVEFDLFGSADGHAMVAHDYKNFGRLTGRNVDPRTLTKQQIGQLRVQRDIGVHYVYPTVEPIPVFHELIARVCTGRRAATQQIILDLKAAAVPRESSLTAFRAALDRVHQVCGQGRTIETPVFLVSGSPYTLRAMSEYVQNRTYFLPMFYILDAFPGELFWMQTRFLSVLGRSQALMTPQAVYDNDSAQQLFETWARDGWCTCVWGAYANSHSNVPGYVVPAGVDVNIVNVAPRTLREPEFRWQPRLFVWAALLALAVSSLALALAGITGIIVLLRKRQSRQVGAITYSALSSELPSEGDGMYTDDGM